MSQAIASRNGLTGTKKALQLQRAAHIRVYVTCEPPLEEVDTLLLNSASHAVKDVLLLHYRLLFGKPDCGIDLMLRSFKRVTLPCIGIIVAERGSRLEEEWRHEFRLYTAKIGVSEEIPTLLIPPDCALIAAARKNPQHCPPALRRNIQGLLHELRVSPLIDRDDIIDLRPPGERLTTGPFALDEAL